MKKLLQTLVLTFGFLNVFAQNPQIGGDQMLCPWTNGTASLTTAQTYDTYQWYSKYWFTTDPFVAISGATSNSFTYDWYTYDQSLLKLVVTLGGNTYESNEILVDSYTWGGLIVIHDMNQYTTISDTNGNLVLCQGASFTNTINNPPYDTSVQWYKDNVAIPGATNVSYDITEAGTYHVEAAPSFCPDNSSTGLPFVVEIDPNCALSTNDPITNIKSELYPNPTRSILTFNTEVHNPIKNYTIIDYAGKILATNSIETVKSKVSIDVSNFSEGFYILIIESEKGKIIKKFIKE